MAVPIHCRSARMCQCQEPRRRCSSWVSEKLEAGEERGKAGQVAIVVQVRLGVAAADEGIGGHRPATAELRVAL